MCLWLIKRSSRRDGAGVGRERQREVDRGNKCKIKNKDRRREEAERQVAQKGKGERGTEGGNEAHTYLERKGRRGREDSAGFISTGTYLSKVTRSGKRAAVPTSPPLPPPTRVLPTGGKTIKYKCNTEKKKKSIGIEEREKGKE